MIVQKDWAVLVSQTASEVVNIGKETGYLPGLLLSNNINKIPEINYNALKRQGVMIETLPAKPTVSDYFATKLLTKSLITLHGYLRIIPPEFFNYYSNSIYNGHPALITKYPELKGLNKQEDIYYRKEEYPTCGSVIHTVIPELDSGEVVVEVEVKNIVENLEQAYYLLRKTSIMSWKYFFKYIWAFK